MNTNDLATWLRDEIAQIDRNVGYTEAWEGYQAAQLVRARRNALAEVLAKVSPECTGLDTPKGHACPVHPRPLDTFLRSPEERAWYRVHVGTLPTCCQTCAANMDATDTIAAEAQRKHDLDLLAKPYAHL